MSQQSDLELLPCEDRIILAIQAMGSDASLSQRRAAATYNVPESTLRTRRAKTTARRDSHPNSSKLTRLEEEAIVEHIRKLDARRFAPTVAYVRHMANQLLADRGGGEVGVNWVTNLIRRKPEIKSQITRRGDHQRVLCSDPAVISSWFDQVRDVKAKYGILDEDTYNFDETGFRIGIKRSIKMVTASERHKPIEVQPGDLEWVTLIAAINATGWVVPPFFIFKAKYHYDTWYRDPKDWRIGVSDNGRTTNELGIAWLKHFIRHTEARTVGSHRLLILDGHESYKSFAFQDLCEQNNIITLYMPQHTSHILQPLDVGCFAPLKRAYKEEIQVLANCYINHIDKEAFLDAYRKVHEGAFSSENIISSFRATGLVPLNPEAVLEAKPNTPTPPAPGPTSWQTQSPSNAWEVEAQIRLIMKKIKEYQSSSPDSVIEIVLRVKKGSALKVHSNTSLEARVAKLEAANQAASERRSLKKRRIEEEGALPQVETEDVIVQRDVEAQFEAGRRERRVQAGSNSEGVRRCKRCGEAGHNRRTCKKGAAAVED